MNENTVDLFSPESFSHYSQLIKKIAVSCGVPRDNSDDIVQNVFLTMYEKYPPMGSLQTKGLITVLSKHRSVDYLRRMSKLPTLPLSDQIENIPADDRGLTDLFIEDSYSLLIEFIRSDPRLRRRLRRKLKYLAKSSDETDIFSLLSQSCIVDKYGRTITSDSSQIMAQIKVDVSEVNERLMKELAANPSLLHQLSPRQFEEVMAELYRKLNYDVSLTPAAHDGGVDIFLATHSDIGAFLFAVQCKKYAPNRPVGVSVIRELYGAQTMGRYTGSIVATTSYFTKDVHKLIQEERLQHQISLQDYSHICGLLKKYQKARSGRSGS
ncbi:restriction endonuclease [Clostridium sp. AM58-1XD]|uniref:restriction endonuclease n=1 Tax=Clostridium sp. AM58-1XD TaxID=2292307 RepID=UPI000E4B8757|nr:restriction endonuclease [Clostridium sp. AM58-1XD]RGY97496.1 hypothetical protein DXA13_14445 [Clostridium sp. AM58-1XD]